MTYRYLGLLVALIGLALGIVGQSTIPNAADPQIKSFATSMAEFLTAVSFVALAMGVFFLVAEWIFEGCMGLAERLQSKDRVDPT